MDLRGVMERYSRYAPGALLALAAFLGGLRAPYPWLVFGGVLLGWAVFRRGGFRAAGREYALLFFCWLAAAAFFSAAPAVSLAALARYSVLAVFFFSASREGEDGWLRAVLGLGLAASLVFIAQKLGGIKDPPGFIGANPNYSAAFAAAAFPAAVVSGLSGSGKKKAAFFALAAVLAAGLLVARSRGALMAAALASLAGLLACGRSRTALIFLGVCAAAAALLPASVLEGLLKLADLRAFVRPRIWGEALQAAAARPLTGWGPGLFGRVFELFKFPYFDGVAFYGHGTLHAHGEFFNLAAEAGFPAALLFLAAAAAPLLGAGGRSLPLKVCAAAVLLQGSVDMVFYSGAVSLLFWGSLGFLTAGEGEPALQRRPAAAALAALCLGGLLFGAVSAGADVGGKRFAAQAAEEAAGGKNGPLSLALAASQELAAPNDPFAAAASGRALALTGDMAGAEAAFKRAVALEPYFVTGRTGLARVYAARGAYPEACAELKLAGRRPSEALDLSYQAATLRENLAAGRMAGSYQAEILRADPDAEKLEKQLCGKKKAGGATARGRKTR